jgi:aromatic ring-opening dioxygenase catalytic subunit (LigB family)
MVGSGFVTHAFHGLTVEKAKKFVGALTHSLTELKGDEREKALVEWEKLPYARVAHPREEHLIPLHVIVGAAGKDAVGKVMYETYSGFGDSAFGFACYRFD